MPSSELLSKQCWSPSFGLFIAVSSSIGSRRRFTEKSNAMRCSLFAPAAGRSPRSCVTCGGG
jgi:hypothetical protein